ncbi:hypothetical protein QYE76_046396 [Lolium multiflorum]|uniref:Uncharacterized protein n=1 Tax=Lolium multiflorum TaxID=4521 RepID=A0AAD8X114_LOLMU|nr:hypothetical protein QYE76_046396 [Lolium multiflorum]
MASNSSSAVVNHGQRLPETSSRCSTETFTAAHNFELANYPLLDDLGIGKYVTSSFFSVGGYDWTIRFYPDGYTQKSGVSAFLYCSSQAISVNTKFSLNMLEKNGKAELTKYGVVEHTYATPSSGYGYHKFIEKSRLRSSPEFRSGCFVIRCVLTVTKQPRTQELKRLNPSVVVPQPNLQDQLLQMLKDGQGADVTFSVSGRLFNAHRYLLAARSPVFKAELFGPMKEKETNTIPIQDIEPSVFEALLHFVYTDSLQDDEHNKGNRVAKLQHLLVAADRYGLNRLRLLCESKMCVDIDMDTVAASLALAEQHHCKDLKEACIQFMAPRNVLQAVMATDGFKHLVESCPFVIIELLDMLCRNG